MRAPLILALVLAWLLCWCTAAPINDDFQNGEDEKSGGLLATSSGLPSIQGATQFFSLSQTVRAPTNTDPPRLPDCLSSSKVSALLVSSINTKWPSSENATVETTLLQSVAECTYISYIGAFNNQMKDQLVDAANTGQLCDVLKEYCPQAFPASSGYNLEATSGDVDPPLPPVIDYKCVKHVFKQQLDHFDNKDQRTFDQVYWVCADAFPVNHLEREHHGNIIVFLGNESPVGIPKQPIVFENARRLRALVLLVEHRYYGESLPFPEPEKGKLPTDLYKWLTIEQVIEDTATVLASVREQLAVPRVVPAMVIGGSYGGMFASYHRVVKPFVFAAAISSSAPIDYIYGTPMWAANSNHYHERIAASLDGNSGSKACSSTVRSGLTSLFELRTSVKGRKRLSKIFKLCPGPAKALVANSSAGFAFYMDQYGAYHGWAQVNNQPSLLGQVELGCNVIADAVAQGAEPLEAVAAANTYFNHNGSDSWCYSFDYNFYLIGDTSGYNSYSYQCCTQGTVYSSELIATGSSNTLTPAYGVPRSRLNDECARSFGPKVPKRNAPWFAKDIKRLVRSIGGIVFTNGELDGWAGGSYWSYSDVLGEGVGQKDIADVLMSGSYDAGHSLAFVLYKGASHCTDTHTFNYNNPLEQEQAYKVQRAQAMDYAVNFMHRYHKHGINSE